MHFDQACPQFAVIPGTQVQECLDGSIEEVLCLVENVYRIHGTGQTVNPPSYFLRFPDKPDARIIALPAALGRGEAAVDGLKWISSYPRNIESGLPRASAVLILNDPSNGYPYACLEASVISAVRTAASAALAARLLTRGRPRPLRAAYVGTGLIARYVHTYLAGSGWEFTDVALHDLRPEYAAGFVEYLKESANGVGVSVHDRAEDAIRSSDLVVFATTAAEPHVSDPSWFAHHPVVLHVSLRDLSPEVIAESFNVVDDVEHCLKANTSVHLLEQRVNNRDFIAGTLYDVMSGALDVPADRTVVFSPFGLGVLDLAVGDHVYRRTAAEGRLITIEGFFSELRRHGRA